MKKITFLLIFFTSCAFAQEKTTIYYLIRHAEKIRTTEHIKDPQLNSEGLKRAKQWSQVFENVTFDVIYSTKYQRTIATATPTSIKKSLEIQWYNPSNLYDTNFQEATKNKTVLIVGHSNTTPAFANKILGTEKYPSIDDRNNGNLYIITIKNGQTTSQLLHIPL